VAFVEWSETNNGASQVIMDAHTTGISRSSGDVPSRSRTPDSRQVKSGPAGYHSASNQSNSGQYGRIEVSANDGNSSSVAHGSALGRCEGPHHEAIILSSEKMSPTKDGTIAHLGSVSILQGHQRAPSLSGIIEEVGEIEPSPLTATTCTSALIVGAQIS
jgi:hypothetical protein